MERKNRKNINNEFYETLNDSWYEGCCHPIALLRSENALRNPWIASVIKKEIGNRATILDIGAGGGFLANYLAKEGHKVHGIDLSESSLQKAKEKDETRTVFYQKADAYNLPYESGSFDVVAAMDILEHVESPEKVIQEAGRVLRKGGIFFFHTFNRNPLSWLVVIKGVELCIRNTPSNMHIYSLFITPNELERYCEKCQLKPVFWTGVSPDIKKFSFWKTVCTGKVDANFSFRFTPSLKTGYSGYALKQ